MDWKVYSWAGIIIFVLIVVWIAGMAGNLWVFRPIHSMHELWKERKEQD